MHTATRIPVYAACCRVVQSPTREAHLCAYGLYAPVEFELLGRIGIEADHRRWSLNNRWPNWCGSCALQTTGVRDGAVSG